MKVIDRRGTGLADVPVTWSVTSGGGSLNVTSTRTDATGRSKVAWKLGTTPGQGTVTAKVEGPEGVTFTATSTASEPARIRVTQESVVLGTWGDTARFVAQVEDQFGNPVSGVSVVWISSDTTIARIDAGGLVSSHRSGVATITAILGTLRSEARAVVQLQMNPQCRIPGGVPARGPVAGAPTFTRADNAFQVRPGRFGMVVVAAGDFTGNGLQDMIIMSSSFPPAPRGGEVLFWRNLGGRFVDATEEMFGATRVVADHPRQIEIVDLNGDGIRDLFVAQTGYDTDPFDGAPDLLFLSQGGRMLEVGATHLQPYERNGYSHASASGDVDCDGDVDLFVGSGGGMHGVQTHHLYLNNGTGRFVAEDWRLPADITPPGLRFVGAAFCDLDNDGDQDLYLGGNDNNADVVLLNDGFGRLRHARSGMFPPLPYGQSGHTVDVRCVDLDGNGMMDLIITAANEDYHWESTARGRFNVWLNRGDLRFEDVTARLAPNEFVNDWVWGAVPVDFNGDGWPDILAKAQTGRNRLYINQGGSRFLSLPAPEGYMDGVDADGDGRTDLFWPGATGPNGEPYLPVLFLAR